MKIRSPLRKKEARLEIIPLIDIMFFLLASFMLVTLSMTKQHTIKVNLPTAVAAKNENAKPEHINLAIDAAGSYYFDKEPIILPDLETKLAERFATDAETKVQISGDADARHGSMVQILDAVRRAGFQNVAFSTRPVDLGGPEAPAPSASPAAPAATPPASTPAASQN